MKFGLTSHRRCGLTRAALAAAALLPLSAADALAQRPRGENSVAALQDQVGAGTANLKFEDHHGYLRSVLKELDVPESSQMLVFSKTSLQRDHISPATPRAIYFNDHVMVGYIPDAPLIEIAAADGSNTSFFTVDQTPGAEKPAFERPGLTCVGCHSTSATRGVTGLLVRSLSVDQGGRLLLDQATHRTEHSSPFAERWGGWYVTGTSGQQTHLGNRIGPPPGAKPSESDEGAPIEAKVLDVAAQLPAARYPNAHSDIVALMVFEHQVGMFNRLAQAGRLGGRFRGAPEDARKRLEEVGDEVVKHLLFADEVPLTDRVVGSSNFTQEFAARGPHDSKGRSLREFDLETRMFRYPLSYLIYSETFDALPGEMKEYVYGRLWKILSGENDEAAPHLSPADRQAIVEILRETKADLPDYWKSAASS